MFPKIYYKCQKKESLKKVLIVIGILIAFFGIGFLYL
ncbi:lipase, partial [Streptococcus suis]